VFFTEFLFVSLDMQHAPIIHKSPVYPTLEVISFQLLMVLTIFGSSQHLNETLAIKDFLSTGLVNQ
jgi:hypothetical protein